jgi:hypothetical protein
VILVAILRKPERGRVEKEAAAMTDRCEESVNDRHGRGDDVEDDGDAEEGPRW